MAWRFAFAFTAASAVDILRECKGQQQNKQKAEKGVCCHDVSSLSLSGILKIVKKYVVDINSH